MVVCFFAFVFVAKVKKKIRTKKIFFVVEILGKEKKKKCGCILFKYYCCLNKISC